MFYERFVFRSETVVCLRITLSWKMSLSGDQFDKTSCYRSYIKYFASVEVFTFPLSINSYVCCIFMLELRHLFSSNINENLTAGVFDHNFGSLKIHQNSGSCPISFTESNYIVCPFMFDVGQTKSNSSRTGTRQSLVPSGRKCVVCATSIQKGRSRQKIPQECVHFSFS